LPINDGGVVADVANGRRAIISRRKAATRANDKAEISVTVTESQKGALKEPVGNPQRVESLRDKTRLTTGCFAALFVDWFLGQA
jgi:DNA-binding transcriptional regulator YiaG